MQDLLTIVRNRLYNKPLESEELNLRIFEDKNKRTKENRLIIEGVSPYHSNMRTDIIIVESHKMLLGGSLSNAWYFKGENELVSNIKHPLDRVSEGIRNLSKKVLNLIDFELNSTERFITIKGNY